MTALSWLTLKIYSVILKLYPDNFRREFSEEMTTIFSTSITEASSDGPGAVARLCLKELTDAPSNLANAYWQEFVDREVVMNRNVSWRVWPTWVLLHLLSLPLAMLFMLIIVIIISGIASPFFTIVNVQNVQITAFVFSFAFVSGLLQWLLIRRYLSHASAWGLATALGFLGGALLAYVEWKTLENLGYSRQPALSAGIIFMSVGACVGTAQFLVLRRVIERAGWWIIASTVGYGILVYGAAQPITSIIEYVFLITLPAIITGAALNLLLMRGQTKSISSVEEYHPISALTRSFRRKSVHVAVGLLIMLVLCLVAPLVWTVGQLTLAKANGIYASAEEGMIATIEQNTGGYEVDHIQVLHAGPNAHNGRLPHIWFVGANVYAEKRPDGKLTGPKGYWSAGSFFVKVKDGWVHVPEGAFPPFMGEVMSWYQLESCCTTE